MWQGLPGCGAPSRDAHSSLQSVVGLAPSLPALGSSFLPPAPVPAVLRGSFVPTLFLCAHPDAMQQIPFFQPIPTALHGWRMETGSVPTPASSWLLLQPC